jgi:hypothetical protein
MTLSARESPAISAEPRVPFHQQGDQIDLKCGERPAQDLSVQVSTPYSPLSHPTRAYKRASPVFRRPRHLFTRIGSTTTSWLYLLAITFGEYVILLLGIKVGCHPIFACFNLVRRIHLQLIDCSTPYRRSTQQLKSSRVEIKMLSPCILARVE